MVWWQGEYLMLFVRAADPGFELLRVSADDSAVIERFARREDAIARWDQMEWDIRARVGADSEQS
jgi:hypothetical protein